MVMGGMGYGKNTGEIYAINVDRGDLNNPNYRVSSGPAEPGCAAFAEGRGSL